MVRWLLAKESELPFFRWHCEVFLRQKRMEIGLSPWVFVSFLPSKKKRKNKLTY
jgi:hypothetical protein